VRGGGTSRGAASVEPRGQDMGVSKRLGAGGNDIARASDGGEGGSGDRSHGSDNERVGN
jgi:hypothetical protein